MTGDIFNYGEIWADIPEFPRYQISTEGRVFNKSTGHFMKSSPNNYGHPKISLIDERGVRHTRSLAMMVARSFVERPNILCDRIIYLNGELSDVRSDNLAWRPRWFCWKYSRQLKLDQPVHYKNLRVVNITTDTEYKNIIEAGITEGLLFEQIWHSTYSGGPVFPNGSIWEIDDRV